MSSCYSPEEQEKIREILKRRLEIKLAEIEKLPELDDSEKYKLKIEAYRKLGEQLLILEGVIPNKEISLEY